MRIALPLHPSPGGGIATLARGLLSALPDALSPTDELLVVGEMPHATRERPNLRSIPRPKVPRRKLERFIEEQWRLSRIVNGVDLLHLCDFRPVLLSRAPFLLTIHDVTFLDHAEWYPPVVAIYKRRMLAAAIQKGPAAIVCVSRHTAERLLAHHPTAARRPIRVIHSGLSEIQAVPQRAVAEPPYFMTVSTVEPRKNHLGLLAAYRRARARGLTLRWKVVGAPGYRSREILSELANECGVDLLGRVPDDALERLYAGATFVAIPSHEEGFGFPALEAMARGVPTASSLGSAVDEVVGEASYRVESSDTSAWVDALERLSCDSALRQRLSEAGLARAARFRWPIAAERYVELYREVT